VKNLSMEYARNMAMTTTMMQTPTTVITMMVMGTAGLLHPALVEAPPVVILMCIQIRSTAIMMTLLTSTTVLTMVGILQR